MKYFTIKELCASDRATLEGIVNTPGDDDRENLISLIENILDPIREAWGNPVFVTSGYRCLSLNSAVGGRAGSAHTLGLAADLQPKDRTRSGVTKLFSAITSIKDLPFERVLLEHNKAKTTWWVHIAYNPQRTLVGNGNSSQYAERIIINDFESNR